MAVIVRAGFTKQQIAKILNDKKGVIRNVILTRLKYIGEQFVIDARNNDTYKDQTGNLRSSIGYVIYDRGILIANNFPGDEAKGKQEGQNVANEVAENFNKGFVLIGVAGMEYAAAVESRGYDVITNSSLIAAKNFRQAIKELKTKIGRL